MSDNLLGRKNGELNRSKSVTEARTFTGDVPTTSTETIFEVLADSDCRAVLSSLENCEEGRATVSDLAHSVRQRTGASTPPAQTAIQLHHAHLPRLEEAGLLTYDQDGGTVQYVGHPLIEVCLGFFDV